MDYFFAHTFEVVIFFKNYFITVIYTYLSHPDFSTECQKNKSVLLMYIITYCTLIKRRNFQFHSYLCIHIHTYIHWKQ